MYKWIFFFFYKWTLNHTFILFPTSPPHPLPQASGKWLARWETTQLCLQRKGTGSELTMTYALLDMPSFEWFRQIGLFLARFSYDLRLENVYSQLLR